MGPVGLQQTLRFIYTKMVWCRKESMWKILKNIYQNVFLYSGYIIYNIAHFLDIRLQNLRLFFVFFVLLMVGLLGGLTVGGTGRIGHRGILGLAAGSEHAEDHQERKCNREEFRKFHMNLLLSDFTILSSVRSRSNWIALLDDFIVSPAHFGVK